VIVDLPFIWAMLIAIAVLMYVVLDGFDLGIGILFPAIKGERNRDVMMKSIAPVWDGNETWLVLGGGGLFAVFPLAYSVLLTAFYAPLIAMLLALVFRGVAFEFRFKDRKHKPLWDLAFAGGSSIHTRHRDRGAQLCRRLVRLVDALQPVYRAGPGAWLCSSRCRLAGDEKHRRAATKGLCDHASVGACHAGGDCGR
jgi:cytochrome d ubiquinol oxidase subunit II